MVIAAFDVIDTGPYIDWLLQLDPVGPVNSNYESLGFETVYVLHNLGTMLLIIPYLLLKLLATKLLLKTDFQTRFHEIGQKYLKQIKYNEVISVIKQSYSVLVISTLINLRYLKWLSFGDIFMSLSALTSTVLIVVFPISETLFVRQKFTSV